MSENSRNVIDFSQLIYGNPIYLRKDNNFQIAIYEASHPSESKLAVKIYTAIKDPSDLNAIEQSEIRILNILSQRAGPDNCFLKYYGYYKLENHLCLIMEYAHGNLMETICE